MEKLLLIWAVVGFFFADAFFNWGLFRSQRYGKRHYAGSRSYTKVGRVLRLAGSGFVLFGVAGMTVHLFWHGGFAALRDPDAFLSSRSPRAAVVPTRVPPPSAQSVEPAAVAPAAVAPAAVEPAAEREATGAPRPADSELRFWVYDDDEGRSHMVDAIEKVPLGFRSRARELR